MTGKPQQETPEQFLERMRSVAICINRSEERADNAREAAARAEEARRPHYTATTQTPHCDEPYKIQTQSPDRSLGMTPTPSGGPWANDYVPRISTGNDKFPIIHATYNHLEDL